MVDKDVELLQFKTDFYNDTTILSKQANAFITSVSPYLSVTGNTVNELLDTDERS